MCFARRGGVLGPRAVATLLMGRFDQPLRAAPARQRERAAAAGDGRSHSARARPSGHVAHYRAEADWRVLAGYGH